MDQPETIDAAAVPATDPVRLFPPRCERCGDIPHPWRECDEHLLANLKPGPKE